MCDPGIVGWNNFSQFSSVPVTQSMDCSGPSVCSHAARGRVHELTSVAGAEAGGGSSTNGSSDTPSRPKKRVRRLET